MKSKVKIIIAAALVFTAALLCAASKTDTGGSAVVLNGAELEFKTPTYRENGVCYIPAAEFFDYAKIPYGKDGNRLIAGDTEIADYRVKNGKIMISAYLAGKIYGGEVTVMENNIYIVKTTPVKVVFRENCKEIEFGYSDAFFAASAYGYNHALAKMSLGAAISAFSAAESDKYWGEDGAFGREANAARLLNDIGFVNIRAYNYDKSLNDATDKAAFITGEKEIELNGEKQPIMAVFVRGGAYGNEWVSNFNVGETGNHKGFSNAAEEIVKTVEKNMGDRDIKLWIAGYSRGAAVANIAAAKLGDGGKIKRDNIYAYTFATPQGAERSNCKNEKYGYIFNIINENDMVPLVVPSEWSFGRYGRDVTFSQFAEFNEETAENKAKKISELYFEISSGGRYDPVEVENSNQSENVRNAVLKIGRAIGGRENYVNKYQKMMMDYVECGNTKIKNDSGKWQWSNAEDGFLYKYGADGEKYVSEARKDEFLKSFGGKMESIGKQMYGFGAICLKNGMSPSQVISEDIGVSNFITIASVFAPSGKNISSFAQAHYPEVYMSLMLTFDAEDMRISK